MEAKPEELLSALRDAEEFISITLFKENLSRETETKRQELINKLKNLTNKSDASSLPPRPQKSIPIVPQEENDGEDLYDDVGSEAIDIKEDGIKDRTMSTSYFAVGIEGVPEESQDTDTPESNEVMSTKEEETYDDTVNVISEENYEEPVKNDGDGTSLEEDTNYEIAETGNAPKPNNTEEETDNLYDGVETTDDQQESDYKYRAKERSATQDLAMLSSPIKAADVKEVIYKGYLDKHRKKGIFIGSKWQRRYCIVRSFVMYYYASHNSDRQKGAIILPGYKVALNKPSKTNREFILTRDQDRSFTVSSHTFQAESKEEVEKWMNAIRKAANAHISNRQSEIIENLRSTQEPDGDEDSSSLCYDDVSEKSKNGSLDNGQNDVGEIYDDVNENEKPEPEEIDYEIPQAESSNKSQNEPPAEQTMPANKETSATVQDDFYEMPGDDDQQPSAPMQPPRSAVDGPSVHSVPGKTPPVDIPPVSIEEEEEELYDDVGVNITSEPEVVAPPPARNLPLPPPPTESSRKASPIMPRPALPSPPREPKQGTGKPSIPPRKTDALPPEPGKESTPNETSSTGKAPPPPPPEETTIPDKAPPPLPEEEVEAQVIDYASIYQALWDCKPDADDELEFNRGDLIYIYEKPHSDWWIGSKYKPQGYQTRLIPRNYLTEAYNV